MLKRILLFCTFIIMATITFAQNQGSTVEMADFMRSSGKINVVVGVLLTIFAVIIAFLFFLEREVKKIEKRLKIK